MLLLLLKGAYYCPWQIWVDLTVLMACLHTTIMFGQWSVAVLGLQMLMWLIFRSWLIGLSSWLRCTPSLLVTFSNSRGYRQHKSTSHAFGWSHDREFPHLIHTESINQDIQSLTHLFYWWLFFMMWKSSYDIANGICIYLLMRHQHAISL